MKNFFAVKLGLCALLGGTGAGAVGEAYTPEELQSGREMLQQMRQISRPRLIPATQIFVRTQTKYSGRLYSAPYLWDDRPLFANRRLWEPGGSDHKISSFNRTLELYQQAGLDGIATFAWPWKGEYNRTLKRLYQAAEKFPDQKVMLEVAAHESYLKIAPETLKLIVEHPSSFRFNGKSVISSYDIDRLPAPKLKKYITQLRQRSGNRILFLPQMCILSFYVDGQRITHLDLQDIYQKYGTLPAPLIEKLKSYLRSYLDFSDGLYVGFYATRFDDCYYTEFMSKVILPIFRAVLAEPAYRHKKLFGLMLKTSYMANFGVQNLSRNGTQTQRDTLNLMREFQPDIAIGTEWDELNEDTSFQPLVSKPMANVRILRAYSDQQKQRAPQPLPGDDPQIPNLIISQRRSLVLGEKLKIELLNLPSTTSSSTYQLKLRLKDERDQVLFQAPPKTFDTAKMAVYNIELASEKFNFARVIRSELRITQNGQTRTFYAGLPFTRLATGVSSDKQYYNTPLRNVLMPQKAQISWHNQQLSCDLVSPESLALLEVLTDEREIWAYDPKNEFMQVDDFRTLFRVNHLYLNNPNRINIRYTATVKNGNSLSAFPVDNLWGNPTKLAAVVPQIPPFGGMAGRYLYPPRLFSLLNSEVSQAVLTIQGKRLTGKNQGETFQWEIPLRRLLTEPVIIKVFPDGLALAVEKNGRPYTIPLPYDQNEAKFTKHFDLPQREQILMVRAITTSGKVFYSQPFAINQPPAPPTNWLSKMFSNKDKLCRIKVFSDQQLAPVEIEVEKSRLLDLNYRFNPAAGNILTTPAGRRFFAAIGTYIALPTGFVGMEGPTSPFYFFDRDLPPGADRPAPVWKQDGADWVLEFDGKRGNFVMFSNLVVPQRASYTISMTIKPQELKSKQLLWAHQAVTYGGLLFGVENGTYYVETWLRNMDYQKPYYSVHKFNSKIPCRTGVWQKVSYSYDGEKITIATPQQRESFAVRGIGLMVQPSHFGGRGRLNPDGSAPFFKGWLKSFRVQHGVEN